MMIKFDAVQIPYSCKPVGRSSVTRPVTSRGVLPYPVYIICYPTMFQIPSLRYCMKPVI